MKEEGEKSETSNNSYGKRALWQWVLIYIVIGGLIYGLIYYFVLSKKRSYNYTNQNVQNQQPTMTSSPGTTTASHQISVEGTEYSFSPSTITVKKGGTVELTFKNNGNFPHNLSIGDLNVKTKTIQSGQQDIITFTPDKTGNFTFVCTVPGHADKGMTGTLIVQ